MQRLRPFCVAVLALLFAAAAFAQGVQTGTIRGVVHDDQGLAIPGVTVTVTSPALQGARTAVTDGTGGYTFATLPPGAYTVKFELSNFTTVTRDSNVPLGGVVEQNVTMKPAGLTEEVKVVDEAP